MSSLIKSLVLYAKINIQLSHVTVHTLTDGSIRMHTHTHPHYSHTHSSHVRRACNVSALFI